MEEVLFEVLKRSLSRFLDVILDEKDIVEILDRQEIQFLKMSFQRWIRFGSSIEVSKSRYSCAILMSF